MALTLLAGCINDAPVEGRSLVGPGDDLPVFEVVMNDGERVTPASLAGEKAVIVFFTTECRDCRALLPELEIVHRSRPELRMVLIARNESAGEIEHYWREHDLTLPYSPQPDADVYHLFATSGVPRVYLVSAAGVIVNMWDDSDVPDAATLTAMMYRKSQG